MNHDRETMQASEVLPPPETKAAYVRAMFGRIAKRYDLMNRLMTLGRDVAWRHYAVEQAAPPPVGKVLDVAAGTGDFGLEILRQQPTVQVMSLDFTPEMLLMAWEKAAEANAELGLTAGDALHLPCPDDVFDAVVTGFALRNVTDIPAAFAEMARVTRTGGRVACLEIAKPQQPVFRRLFAFYFYRLVPLFGRLITGEPSAYTYLPNSLTAFLTPDEIVEVMRASGWRDVQYRRMMLGTVAVHTGVRS